MSVRWVVLAVVAGCGQSADVIGQRNDLPPPPEDTGWRTDFEACATERVEAALVPTSLLLAVDRSCSMDDPADGRTTGTTTKTPSKWDAATGAFTSFFTDPAAATLSVALRLWPTPDGCDEVACDAVACSVPQVPLGSVGDPAHQQALIDTLLTTAPDGTTPMHAALDGATQWAAARQLEAPGEAVAVVFVTDGEPNGCDEDIANIAALAASSSAAGVPVYTVGIEGSNVKQIDQIAAAGGTMSGYFVGSANAEAQLLAALEDIQAREVSCRYTFPDDPTADPLSPDLVRVEYEANGEVVSVPRVAGAAACGAEDGWYLDDPEDPTTITMCPTTCTALQDIDETVAIEIDVGCECLTDEDCSGDEVCSPDGCVPPCEGPDCFQATGDGPSLVGQKAVQGGALTCATTPAAGGLALLVALLAVRFRREDS